MDENFRFRAWVKFRCKMPDEELDALVRATADEVWAGIDCLECGQCCRALRIVVDDKDIARLAKRLQVSKEALRRQHVDIVEGEQGFAAQPCFLLDGNACKVYEDRPTACRDFPYLHAEEFSRRMLGLIEFSLLCPVVFYTLEALKRKLPWRKKRA